MIRASWDGVVLAEAEQTVVVEGNHYFPPEALDRRYFADSARRTLCPWKGVARYYDVTVAGQTYPDLAWYYPRPSPLARRIRNRVAFWPGVEIERTGPETTSGRHTSGWLRSLLGGTR